VSQLKLEWMTFPVMLLGIAFLAVMLLKGMWIIICRAWGTAFEGMADQGDDWSPFPWSGKPERKCIYVLPKRNPLIEIIVDPSRPAWHSAVGVELAGREVGA